MTGRLAETKLLPLPIDYWHFLAGIKLELAAECNPGDLLEQSMLKDALMYKQAALEAERALQPEGAVV